MICANTCPLLPINNYIMHIATTETLHYKAGTKLAVHDLCRCMFLLSNNYFMDIATTKT